MDNLGVDYVLLAEKIERLFGLSTKLCDEIGIVAGNAEDLDIFWDGDANSTFIAGFCDDVTEMGIIMMRIKQTVSTAGKVFDIYMKNEREIKRMIGDYRI